MPWDPFPFNYVLDFTFVRDTGTYQIQSTDGIIVSPIFRIGAYPPVFEEVVRFMQTHDVAIIPILMQSVISLYGVPIILLLQLQPRHITYWDDWADYSTNEPTMDGSADLFLILTYLHGAGRKKIND